MLQKKNIFILLFLTALFYIFNIPTRVFECFFLLFALAFILPREKEYVFSQSSAVLVRWNFACFCDGKVYCNTTVPGIYNGKNGAWYMYCTYSGS